MAKTKSRARKLNPRQELFCKLYAEPGEFFGNGTQAYIEAYGVDMTKPGAYAVARNGAYDNLTKSHLLARIRKLLELGPLNNESVDREMAFVIVQNADLPSKMRAISEYNKLKKRITDKLESEIIHKWADLTDEELDRAIKARQNRLP